MSSLCGLFLLVIHIVISSCINGLVSATARCIPEHNDSLLLLKGRFHFANNSKVASWFPGTDCCRWKGVSCDAQSGEVTHLNLSDNSLSGEIHPALFNLTSLRSLDFSSNNFGTRIPSQGFEWLMNLTSLNFSGSSFLGQIPIGISRLTNLISLDLGRNFDLKLEDPDLGTLVKYLNRLEELVLDYVNVSGIGNNWCHALWSSTPILRRLSMSNCFLVGPLDCSLLGHGPMLGNFSSLVSLDLSYNSLVGSIPGWLFSHSSLQSCHLSSNKISGFSNKMPNVSSSSLQYLYLPSNELWGRIPPFFFNLSHLRLLDLDDNHFSGSMSLSSFNCLVNLTALSLSNNLITVESDQIEPLIPQFTVLRLASCNIKKFPGFLRHQHRLTWLSLSSNAIKGRVPSWLWASMDLRGFLLDLSFNQLSGLERPPPILSSTTNCSIYMNSNRFKGPIPLPPCNMNGALDYSDNYLSGSIVPKFGVSIKYALAVRLSKNNLTGEIPTFFCDMAQLELLELSHNNLHGSLPSCLMKLHNLRALDLKGNVFSGTIPSNFGPRCALELINLNANMLEGDLPVSLANCTSLKHIDIGNNMIEDHFPFWISKFQYLSILVLKNNKFKGLLPREWNGTFKCLQILDLSHNNFNGTLPGNLFKNLKAMQSSIEFPFLYFIRDNYSIGYTHITSYPDFVSIISKNFAMDLEKISMDTVVFDLSCNQFEGSIPDEIGELAMLKVLNLSHNHILGTIPHTLGKLREVESLDLSCNSIYGMIPMELTSMTFLSVLNLSYNFLSGKIPTTQQFSTFTSNSYIGNKGLCGSPVSKVCQGQNKTPLQSSLKEKDPIPNWKLLSFEIGFVVGLVLWNGTLQLWPNGRRYLDAVILKYCMCS